MGVKLLKKQQILDAYHQARVRSNLDDGGEQWYERMDVYHGLSIVKRRLDNTLLSEQWDYNRITEAQALIQTSVTETSAFGRICILADYVPEFRDDKI